MWYLVNDKLPDVHQPVVCISVDRYENTGGDWDRNVQDCVYLSEMHGHKYWSKCGERAISLSYYTHWMPLPAPPTAEQAESANLHTTNSAMVPCDVCGVGKSVAHVCADCVEEHELPLLTQHQ